MKVFLEVNRGLVNDLIFVLLIKIEPSEFE